MTTTGGLPHEGEPETLKAFPFFRGCETEASPFCKNIKLQVRHSIRHNAVVTDGGRCQKWRSHPIASSTPPLTKT
ncbi:MULTISPECIES: hypothetical protein [unclassified Microcoleus]|uniref:hypothetical protein n=1 Tax=unclassified Microcoleus TaxID=2642155 RepID=UPI002FCE8707